MIKEFESCSKNAKDGHEDPNIVFALHELVGPRSSALVPAMLVLVSMGAAWQGLASIEQGVIGIGSVQLGTDYCLALLAHFLGFWTLRSPFEARTMYDQVDSHTVGFGMKFPRA
ncbi:hypothetical protein JCGZ_00501 [Jatropha curcas]|uniref:Uncharacterized protein n=1 Tax=Jatropha curcas TaxID=180498 RepID=A0A067JJR1_JATCU|nr:hypothetical protein JCGZ_00501 [Jatropha curcas]